MSSRDPNSDPILKPKQITKDPNFLGRAFKETVDHVNAFIAKGPQPQSGDESDGSDHDANLDWLNHDDLSLRW